MYENSVEAICKAQKGDKEELEKLVENNQGLIWSIVKRFIGRGYETEDLYQIGCIGFIKSIKRFDTSFNVQLSTYSVPYILGEIKRFIRDDGPIKISRNIKELETKIKEIQREYLAKKGVEIGLSEIAKRLKITKEEVAMALDSRRCISSLDDCNYRDQKSGSKISILDKLSSGKDESELIANRLTVKALIENLEDKEKQIIMLRFYKEKTQTQVAKILGITQVQVSRIERKVLNKMKVKLEEGA